MPAYRTQSTRVVHCEPIVQPTVGLKPFWICSIHRLSACRCRDPCCIRKLARNCIAVCILPHAKVCREPTCSSRCHDRIVVTLVVHGLQTSTRVSRQRIRFWAHRSIQTEQLQQVVRSDESVTAQITRASRAAGPTWIHRHTAHQCLCHRRFDCVRDEVGVEHARLGRHIPNHSLAATPRPRTATVVASFSCALGILIEVTCSRLHASRRHTRAIVEIRLGIEVTCRRVHAAWCGWLTEVKGQDFRISQRAVPDADIVENSMKRFWQSTVASTEGEWGLYIYTWDTKKIAKTRRSC